MNILIAEDNPIVAMDLGWMLQDLGHNVSGIATTSIKAMEQTALKNPDLVMVDLNLVDGRTGLGLVEALAQLHVPTIIVSGETHTVSGATSARAVLAKPFDEVRLADAIAIVEEAQRPENQVSLGINLAEAGVHSEAGVLQGVDVLKPRRSWFGWFWGQRT